MITKVAFALITVVVVMVVVIMNQNEIDCNDPMVWSTESGVRHCAINGGK